MQKQVVLSSCGKRCSLCYLLAAADINQDWLDPDGQETRVGTFNLPATFIMYVDNKMYIWYRMHAMAKYGEQKGDEVRPVRTYTATIARQKFSDLFDEAFYKGPVIVQKNSKSVAVVSIELLRDLMAVDVEAEGDVKQAHAALREFLSRGGTRLDDLKRELDL